MNVAIISGNLVRDPEVSFVQGANATEKARFTVACQRKFKNAQGTYDADFINVDAWGNDAKFVQDHFHKGDRIEVAGEIRTGSYTNKDGVKVYTTTINANRGGIGYGSKASSTDSGDSKPMSKPTVKQELDLNIPEDTDEEMPF